jgi:hypothetical protein
VVSATARFELAVQSSSTSSTETGNPQCCAHPALMSGLQTGSTLALDRGFAKREGARHCQARETRRFHV